MQAADGVGRGESGNTAAVAAVTPNNDAALVGTCELGSATFSGFLATQFLGAFNDNYFKQMVLLTCVALAAAKKAESPDGTAASYFQPLAMFAFALPFVLLSGVGGYLSDRYSKSAVIVLCKVAEIVIMALALVALAIPSVSPESQLLLLIVVLALMGGQSAIFGPSKYGALPELFPVRLLLPVNGAVQMTTFLAIIFGMVCAGVARDQLQGNLWIGSLIAVGIAVVGTLTSLLIQRTPAAAPLMHLKTENLHFPSDVRRLFRDQPAIFQAALVASLFWFLGGVTQPAVNDLGTEVLQLNETRTSLLVAGIGVGIAAGCILAGVVARKFRGSNWVRGAAWCLVVCLIVIAVLSSGACGLPVVRDARDVSVTSSILNAGPIEWGFRLAMVALGVASGAFVVPIQTFLQMAPPTGQKGRLLGSVNLLSWIAIVCSAIYLGVGYYVLALLMGAQNSRFNQSVIFASLALMIVPIALWYRLGERSAVAANH
ncbi:MAG: MFS transporter [Planctomycetaceae bacterium]|nr:MFS transporter [Planctomycetaceae bacterium]